MRVPDIDDISLFVFSPDTAVRVLTNHDDTSTETFSGKGDNTDFFCNSAEALALVRRLAKLRDEGVGRVRDDSAYNTSEIARGEGDAKLSTLAVGFLGLREDMSIEELYDLLKEEEFGHGVGDLIDHPQSRTAYEENFLDLPDATTGEQASQRGTGSQPWSCSSL